MTGKIDYISIDLNGRKLQFNMEEAKELYELLKEFFPEETLFWPNAVKDSTWPDWLPHTTCKVFKLTE